MKEPRENKRDVLYESSRKRKCSKAGPFQGRECRVKVVVSGQTVGSGLVCQMPDIVDAIPSTIVFESPTKTQRGEGEPAGSLAALLTESRPSGLAKAPNKQKRESEDATEDENEDEDDEEEVSPSAVRADKTTTDEGHGDGIAPRFIRAVLGRIPEARPRLAPLLDEPLVVEDFSSLVERTLSELRRMLQDETDWGDRSPGRPTDVGLVARVADLIKSIEPYWTEVGGAAAAVPDSATVTVARGKGGR